MENGALRHANTQLRTDVNELRATIAELQSTVQLLRSANTTGPVTALEIAPSPRRSLDSGAHGHDGAPAGGLLVL